MTTYVNIYGIQTRSASPDHADSFVNPITNINTSNPQVVSWATIDDMSIVYGPTYYDGYQGRNYIFYFNTPDDGITHNYTFSGYFNIPTGYLTKSVLSFTNGLFGIYEYPFGPFHFVSQVLSQTPAYWTSTPVSLSNSGLVLGLLPNFQYQIVLQLKLQWTTYEKNHLYNGDYDICPLDTGFSVFCPDFSGGAIQSFQNSIRMIIEQN